jgi:hypothetical protein
MKVNLENWDKKPIKFYCDGIEINCVVEADDIQGYIEFYEKDDSDIFYYREKELVKKRIYGRIRIEHGDK